MNKTTFSKRHFIFHSLSLCLVLVALESASSQDSSGSSRSGESKFEVGFDEARANNIQKQLDQPQDISIPNLDVLNNSLKALVNEFKSCSEARNSAFSQCDMGASDLFATAKKYGDIATAMISQMSGMDSCGGLSQGIGAANAALKLYKTTCETNKALCDKSCGSVVSKLKQSKTQIETLRKQLELKKLEVLASDPPNSRLLEMKLDNLIQSLDSKKSSIEEELQSGVDFKTFAGKLGYCAGAVQKQMNDTANSLAQGLKVFEQSKNCDAQANAQSGSGTVNEAYCYSNPTDTRCDCSLESNKPTARCMCLENPRAIGCANGLAKVGSGGSDGIKSGAGNSQTSKPNTDMNLDLDDGETPAFAAKPDQAGQIPGGSSGAPFSSGGGGSGGNQLSQNKGGGGGVGENKPSLVGGWASGGGGGGRLNAAGSDGDEKSKARQSALAKFLPGGEKDPRRGLASTKEITANGGLSNWEKVRARYRDQVTSLINQNH